MELIRCCGTIEDYGEQVASRRVLQFGNQVSQVLLFDHGFRSRTTQTTNPEFVN
jgi:hypothetical protein